MACKTLFKRIEAQWWQFNARFYQSPRNSNANSFRFNEEQIGGSMKSGNGWPASAVQSEIGIGIFTVVPGIRPVRLRCAKAVAPLLVAACKEWHKKVEKLKPGEVQGYAFRDVRGGSGTLSNHASGTAVDIWPSRHPQGDKDGNLTKEQQNAILEICKKYGLRSGGTYKTAKPDWMHIEIDLKPAKVAELIASLKGK